MNAKARQMLAAALAAPRILLHSTGPHVKEDGSPETIEEFLLKKRSDLEEHKIIYWYNKHSRPDWLHPVIKEPTYVIMFNSGRAPKAGGGLAQAYNQSTLREAGIWRSLPHGMKVTGTMNKGAAALVISEFEDCRGETIDLAQFTSKGANDRLSVWKTDHTHPQGGDRRKDLVAIGLVTAPYAVWLK